MKARRRFLASVVAVATAASLSTGVASAADNVADSASQLGGSITGSAVLPAVAGSVQDGKMTTEEGQAVIGSFATAGTVVTGIAISVAVIAGLYTFAQSQGWIK